MVKNKKRPYEEQAVRDAQRLVAFAAKKGIEIDEEILEKLTIAEEKLRNDEWTPEFAVMFWKAFGNISEKIHPATLDNVKAICTEPMSPGFRKFLADLIGRSPARRTINIYTLFTLLVMAILLAVQIYWVVGNTLEVKLTELLEKEVELTVEINKSKHDLSELELLYKIKEMEKMDNQSYSIDYAFDFYSTPEWEREKLQVELNITQLDNELESIKKQLERNYSILREWAGPWANLITGENIESGGDKSTSQEEAYDDAQIEELTSQIEHYVEQIKTHESISDEDYANEVISRKDDQIKSYKDLLDPEGEDNSEIQTEIDKLEKELVNREELKQQLITQRINALQELREEKSSLERQRMRERVKEESRKTRLGAGFVLGVLESYILPVLYALLGASAYVLRSTAREVREWVYTVDSNGGYILRLALGTLAGLMVGWFVFLLPSRTFLASISPLAIAFLVGYNIEILFSWMDTIIKKISATEKPALKILEGQEGSAEKQPS